MRRARVQRFAFRYMLRPATHFGGRSPRVAGLRVRDRHAESLWYNGLLLFEFEFYDYDEETDKSTEDRSHREQVIQVGWRRCVW